MQRDMDLVRTILLRIEAEDTALFITETLIITGYHDDLVSEHLRLMAQAGLLDVFPSEYLDDTEKLALSWLGHEFLDNARNNGTWNKVRKAVGGKFNTVSFSVLSSLLTWMAEEAAKGNMKLPIP